MNEETKNKNSKKVNKYYILVFILILVIGIITATYAFFQIDTDNSSSNTTITANADCFNITFEDLSEEELINLDINYPITDEYALGQTDSIYNLKPVVVKISNKCTQIQDNLNYKLAITTLAKDPVDEEDKGYIPDNKVRYNVKKVINKDTEEDSESLRNPDYLSSLSLVEDANIISILNEEITKKEININEYDTVNTYIIDSDSLASNTYSTYYLRLWIDYYEGDSEAYTNPEGHEDRTYTCGDNQCKYDNSTQGQKFESVISLIADGTTSKPPKSTLELLREKDNQGYLSENPVPEEVGMYRYQATSISEEEAAKMTNWICFGTTENCGTNDNNIDKYMYRIIGITEEGELYLLKETFLKEGTVSSFKWNTKYQVSDCLGDKCEWPNSDLYKRLNGETSNGNPIFVDNSYYEYMTKNSDWYNLIADHNWMYGDTNTKDNSIIYNGNEMYAIETGKTSTKRYWPDEDQGQTTCSDNNPCTEKDYTWIKSVPAKVGLMYIHDIDYAYTGGNPGSSTNVFYSWIDFRKDGYNEGQYFEWLTTRFGVEDVSGTSWTQEQVFVFITGTGDIGDNPPYDQNGSARPVFYLTSEVKIKEGTDGTKENPYILDVQE